MVTPFVIVRAMIYAAKTRLPCRQFIKMDDVCARASERAAMMLVNFSYNLNIVSFRGRIWLVVCCCIFFGGDRITFLILVRIRVREI